MNVNFKGGKIMEKIGRGKTYFSAYTLVKQIGYPNKTTFLHIKL